MSIESRLNKLQQKIMPSQQWVWVDSVDDIPSDITNLKLVCWIEVANKIKGLTK